MPITLEELRILEDDSVEEDSQIPFIPVGPSNDRQIEKVTVNDLLDRVFVDQGALRTFASH